MNIDIKRIDMYAPAHSFRAPRLEERVSCYPVAKRPVGAGRWSKDTIDHVKDNAAVPSDLISFKL